jgi:hypothetical protein
MAFPVAEFTCIVNSQGASVPFNICCQPMCWRYCKRVSWFCFSVSYILFTSCCKFVTSSFCDLTDSYYLLWELLWWCVHVEQDVSYFWPRILSRGGVIAQRAWRYGLGNQGNRGSVLCRGWGWGWGFVFTVSVSPLWRPQFPVQWVLGIKLSGFEASYSFQNLCLQFLLRVQRDVFDSYLSRWNNDILDVRDWRTSVWWRPSKLHSLYSHSPTYLRVAFRGTLHKSNFT